MRTEFGAATWMPKSSALFSNSLRLGEQWRALRDSEAVRLLLDLPAVKMLMVEAMTSPGWQQFQEARAQMPMVDVGLAVLADAFSQEVFVCLDERWKTFGPALSSLYVQSALAGLTASFGTPQGARVIDAVLADKDALRLPGAVVGFRMTEPERARELLAELIAMVKDAAPLPLREETIGGAKYFVLRLDGSMIPADAREDIRFSLEIDGTSEERLDKFDAWLRSQTLAVAIGLREDYLLLSIGGDTVQLEALGTGESLAESTAFAPIRGCFKPGVLSLSYLCAELTSRAKVDVEAWLSKADEWMEEFRETMPEGLEPLIRKDVEAFLNDVNGFLPDAQPELAVSFLNGGIESYSFVAASPNGPDTSKPLSILASVGPSPLLAIAGRSAPAAATYDAFARWVEVAYSYFEDYAVPAMSNSDLSQFRKFEETFLATIRRMHVTTKSELIPAVDACESLFVLGGAGELKALPDVRVELPRPVRYPQPALVMQLNDGKMLEAAMGNYRDAIHRFLAKMAETDPDAGELRLPAPDARPFAGGTLYSYPIPIPPMLGLSPNAVVTADRAVMAITEQHSTELLKPSAIPDGGVVDFMAPAIAAAWIDIAGFQDMLFDNVELAVEVLDREGEAPPDLLAMIRAHVPRARKILGVFRHYASVNWIDDKTQVTHSWLKIVDAAK
jgi:hypothetical protein